jgi:hypothetical protein
MRRPQGYATIVEPGRPLEEFDTASCCHCSAAIRVKPNTVATVYLVFNRASWLWEEVPGASCWHCMKPVCLTCHDKGICLPLERMLEQAEHHR